MRYVAEIALTLGLLIGQTAKADTLAATTADNLQVAFLNGNYAQEVSDSLDGLMITASRELNRAGYKDHADRITKEWAQYHGFLLRGQRLTGVGDHEPITWMYDTWFLLNSLLGEEIMKMTHLDDIWEFAYTIPVVFWCEDQVDVDEFEPHFVMFAGDTAYWVTMAACTIGTYGTTASLLCSPIGVVCENIMVDAIAPPLSPKVWKMSCNQ